MASSNQDSGVGVGFFSPTPEVQLDNFLHHTSKLGIPVNGSPISFKTC